MGTLRIGTCSWKYSSWHPLVYSAADGINYLEEYAERYATVEIDQWFWSLFGERSIRLPATKDAALYRRSVPDDFRFTVKVPDSITLSHFRQRGRGADLTVNPSFLSVELFTEFLARIEPLHDLLGPLIFQFEYLNKKKMPSQAQFHDRFAAFATRLPKEFVYGIETRNGNYLNDAYFSFLAEATLVPVLLQGYWMPPVTELYRRWGERLRRHPTIILRLHGADREGIERQTAKKWNQIVAPKDDELAALVAMVRELQASGQEVYLNVNNHYEGSAPLTIARISELLR